MQVLQIFPIEQTTEMKNLSWGMSNLSKTGDL